MEVCPLSREVILPFDATSIRSIYRAAFAFSTIPYPQPHQLSLRFAFPAVLRSLLGGLRAYHERKANPWLLLAPVSGALPASVRFHRWTLGFRQFSFSHIAQALQSRIVHAF